MDKESSKVVIDTTKIQLFKQITTWRVYDTFAAEL